MESSSETNRLAHTSDLLVSWLARYRQQGHHHGLSPLHQLVLRRQLEVLHDELCDFISALPDEMPLRH